MASLHLVPRAEPCPGDEPRAPEALRPSPPNRPSAGVFDVRGRLQRLPRTVIVGQLVCIAVLAIFHATITWAPKGTYHPLIVGLADVDSETNLPTWFSSTQWMLLTLTLAAIAVLSHAMRRSRLVVALWALGAAAALYFSADEVAMFHERFGTILEEGLEDAPAGSRLRALFDLNLTSYYWVMAYLPFIVPAIVGGAIFLWKELGVNRRMALLGMFVFVYGAVGLDWIEGRYGTDKHTEIVLQIASRRIGFDILLMEEGLEMLGVALVLYAFLRHLSMLAARALDVSAREHSSSGTGRGEA